MSQERWSIRTAQIDAADAGDAAGIDGAEVADNQEIGEAFPPDFGVNLGTLLILNYVRDENLRLATSFGLSTTQLKPIIDSILDPYYKNFESGEFMSILRGAGGNPQTLTPDEGTIEGIFQTLVGNQEYNPASIEKQKAVTLQYLPSPAGNAYKSGGKGQGNVAWGKTGKELQTLINQQVQQLKSSATTNLAVQQFTPQLAPLAGNKSRTIVAQVEQTQQGPLSVGRYESISQLKDDLIAMGPKPETYEKIMSMVGPDNEDSAKDALSSFYQGMAASLGSIYDMLVGVGMANPIDADIVEQLQSQHPDLNPSQPQQHQNRPHVNKPEDMAMASNEKPPKIAGLYLPAANSGINTKSENLNKQAATSAYPAYESHGPGENRFCPKIRKDVNTFICRNHCLDGLIVDDHQVLCGEAIWRQSIMDKFSSEYRDKDGNWTGGYLEKRFEIHHDDGGHPALLKPGQRHAPIHEDAWSLEKRMSEMRKSEGGSRGYNTPKDKTDLYNFDQHDLSKGPKNPQAFEKKKDNISKLAISVGDSLLDKSAQNNQLPPDQGGLDDFMTQQHSDDFAHHDVPTDSVPPEVTLDGYAEKLDRGTGEWETVMVSQLKGVYKGDKKIDIGLMSIVEGSDGSTYAVTPQTLKKPEAPKAPELPPAEPDAPWSVGAGLNPTFNRFSKKKKKKKTPASGWVPYHIWVTQKDEPKDEHEEEECPESSESSEGMSATASTKIANSQIKQEIEGMLPPNYRLSFVGNGWVIRASTPDRKQLGPAVTTEELPSLLGWLKANIGDRQSLFASNSWSMTKEAWGLHAPKVPKLDYGSDKNDGLGEGANHGPVGKRCAKCQKVCGPGAMVCDNPNCRCPNLVNYNQHQAEEASGSINNQGLIPIAASDAEIHYANGVYRASKNGCSGYGENPEEAIEKLAQSLEHLKPGTIDQQGSEIIDARQNHDGLQENQTLVANPLQEEAPIGVIDPTPTTKEIPPPAVMDESLPPPEISMDSTPSTDAVPAEDASPIPVEIGPNSEGQQVSEFIPEFSGQPGAGAVEPHVSSDLLDSHLASEHVKRHPNERQEVELQAINSGAHPD